MIPFEFSTAKASGFKSRVCEIFFICTGMLFNLQANRSSKYKYKKREWFLAWLEQVLKNLYSVFDIIIHNRM